MLLDASSTARDVAEAVGSVNGAEGADERLGGGSDGDVLWEEDGSVDNSECVVSLELLMSDKGGIHTACISPWDWHSKRADSP